VAASKQNIFDPIQKHIKRLRTWWTALLGPALGQQAQLAGAMALSVFGGSFDDDSAAAVLTAVPGSEQSSLLQALALLTVLQDVGAWAGEASLPARGLVGTYLVSRHATPCTTPCHAVADKTLHGRCHVGLPRRRAMHHLHREVAAALLRERDPGVAAAVGGAFVERVLALGGRLEELWDAVGKKMASAEEQRLSWLLAPAGERVPSFQHA
jgi:hypothetical protein